VKILVVVQEKRHFMADESEQVIAARLPLP